MPTLSLTMTAQVPSWRMAFGNAKQLPSEAKDTMTLSATFEDRRSLAMAGDNADSLNAQHHPSASLDCTFQPRRTFQASTMNPPFQHITFIQDQDITLVFQMCPVVAITGWAIGFKVKDAITSGTTMFTKTTSDDITITDGVGGTLEVAIADTDTSSLDATEDLADGKGYVWELKRTDAGSELVLARGHLTLEKPIF